MQYRSERLGRRALFDLVDSAVSWRFASCYGRLLRGRRHCCEAWSCLQKSRCHCVCIAHPRHLSQTDTEIRARSISSDGRYTMKICRILMHLITLSAALAVAAAQTETAPARIVNLDLDPH